MFPSVSTSHPITGFLNVCLPFLHSYQILQPGFRRTQHSHPQTHGPWESSSCVTEPWVVAPTAVDSFNRLDSTLCSFVSRLILLFVRMCKCTHVQTTKLLVLKESHGGQLCLCRKDAPLYLPCILLCTEEQESNSSTLSCHWCLEVLSTSWFVYTVLH